MGTNFIHLIKNKEILKIEEMRKISTIVLLFFISFCKSQNLPIDKETGKVTYQKIIEFDSACTKLSLFNAFSANIATVYGDSKDVIRLSDKEQGKIICKGAFKMHSWADVHCGYWNYTLTCDIRDYKCRVIITNIFGEGMPGFIVESQTAEELNGINKKVYQKWRNEIENNCQELLMTFTKLKCANKNDW